MAAVSSSDVGKLSDAERSVLSIISQGSHKFAIDLYRALSSKTSGNVFVSPMSAQIVLVQAYLGAKGSTAVELAKLLSLPDKRDDTLIGYNILIKVLQDPVLNLANRMFVEASAKVKKEFQDSMEKYFVTPAESLNFKEEPEAARTAINSWVEVQTKKKITNLLPLGSISTQTRLVLANAIHFKANWEHMFREQSTTSKPFYVSRHNKVPVQMMSIKNNFAFSHNEELKAKILGMNYEGGSFQMVIILPDEIDGLKQVEEKLANVDLAGIVNDLPKHREVIVSLPKFKLEETMVLNEFLESLGATTMFTDQADLSGITTEEPLKVSVVVQKSFVEVNEKGTEAAAATGMVCSVRCLKPPPEKFIADHPFLFFINSVATQTPIFVGSYCSP